MGITGRLLRVQRGEGRTAGLTVALMFTTSAGLTIGESGVTALFLDHFGARALPTMYLGQGVAGLAAMIALTGWLARTDRRRAYVTMPLLLAALVLVERAVLAAGPGWIYPILWLTVTLDWLLQAVFLWGTAGLVTDTRRAKRLFPLFAAGGILGAVVGGLLTRVLAGTIGAENLLLIWLGSLLGGAALCATVIGLRGTGRPRSRLRRRRQRPWRDIAQGLSFVRRSPLLVWMTVAAVLFSVLFYSLYLPFAQKASDRFPDPADLAGFLGLFWAAATGVAFLTSVLLANRLLGWLGAAAMILILPILYAGSFGVLIASSSLATLVVTRFVVSIWLQGVTSPAWETLVNVVPESRRDQVRAFLNGGPTQVGTVIAGLVTLLGQRILTARQLTITGLAISAATIATAWRIRRSYVGALLDALRAGRPRVFERTSVEGVPALLERDAQALTLALEASGDRDPRLRRLAAGMLSDGVGDARARNAVVTLTRDEDATVRALAVRALGRTLPVDGSALESALADDDRSVRLAAIESLGAAVELAPRVRAFVADPDPAVAAAASAALVAGQWRAEATDRLRALLSDEDPDVRVATVRRIDVAPAPDVIELLRPMLDDGSASVRTQALRTLAASAPDAAIDPAVDALFAADVAMRETAFDVLGTLDLRDHGAELLDRAQLESSRARSDHDLATSIPPDGDAQELLRGALVDRGRSRALVALSAVALMSGDRDAMRTALQNLRATEPGQLANALETLETSEHRSLVRPLLPLWEEGQTPPPTRDDWLEAVSRDPDPLIRACVELVRTTAERGDPMSRARTSMSQMERVLVLRGIALFAELSPAELQNVAEIAEERAFSDGEVIAVEGETGDELHIVLAGMVEVVRGRSGTTSVVARRGPGEVVGEMSIITRAPRVASLIADGDVRTLRIGHREFESMLRERPDVSLAVMRVLAERLGVETVDR